jgi:NADPH2:quinone reductase
MRALLSRHAGGPETLELGELPEPVAASGQVRVAVRACGVNFPDWLIIQDLYQVKPPRPFAPGGEISGVVDALGTGVEGLCVGDRVLMSPVRGGMAEKVVAAAGNCWKIPDAMPFDQAAALLLTYGTSQHALADRARLKPGETLLVLGAAGGVGLAAVELGKAIGALDKAAARALTDQFKSVCGADGAQVIFDPVGGDYTEAALRAIGWQGRYLVVGFTAGIPKLPLNLTLLKSCQIIGVFWGEFTARQPRQHAANVASLMALYLGGHIKPAVSERFPLQRGMEAIARLGARAARGKVVVMIE